MKTLLNSKSRQQKENKGLVNKSIDNCINILVDKLQHEIKIFRKFTRFTCEHNIKVTNNGIEDIDKLNDWEYKDEFFKIYDPLNNVRMLDEYNEKVIYYNLLLEKIFY